jgi:hypothetical protein
MSSFDDADRLLASLPRCRISAIPNGTPIPPVRAVGVLSDYNGFTGKERLRTFEVAKWLAKIGAMPHSLSCNICSAPTDQQHAEDYYDLSTWIDICRGCHTRLHQRFRFPASWQTWLGARALPEQHWTKHLFTSPTDLAALLRSRGACEPTFQDFA